MLRASIWRSHTCSRGLRCPGQKATFLRHAANTLARPLTSAGGRRWVQRRHYAVAVEQTNKGVVSRSAILRKKYVMVNPLLRTPVIHFSKGTPPTILTRCTCHGNMILQASISHGRFTSGIWSQATCQFHRLSNPLLQLSQHLKVECHQ